MSDSISDFTRLFRYYENLMPWNGQFCKVKAVAFRLNRYIISQTIDTVIYESRLLHNTKNA